MSIIHQANDIQQDPLLQYNLQAFFMFTVDFGLDTVLQHYYKVIKSLKLQQWQESIVKEVYAH